MYIKYIYNVNVCIKSCTYKIMYRQNRIEKKIKQKTIYRQFKILFKKIFFPFFTFNNEIKKIGI